MANNLPYKLSLDDLQFQRKLDSAINKTGKLDSKMKGIGKTGNGVSNTLSTGFSKLGTAIAGAFTIGKVVDFGAAVIDSLSKYEMFMSSITTMLGGNKGMAEALNSQLVELARTTPFSLEDVQTGSKQLLAYGFRAGDLTKQLKTLGNVSAGVGAPLGDIVYLYGTLKTQGRAYAKDIQQFTGRGIPIIKELAKQFKTTDANVMQLVKDGKIGFKEIEKAFTSMTSEGGQFFNLMENQSKTIGGMKSNLGDSWEQIKVEIGKSQQGILASTLNFINKYTDILGKSLKSQNNFEAALGEQRSVGFFDLDRKNKNMAQQTLIDERLLTGNETQKDIEKKVRMIKELTGKLRNDYYLNKVREQGTTDNTSEGRGQYNGTKLELSKKDFKRKEEEYLDSISLYTAALEKLKNQSKLLKATENPIDPTKPDPNEEDKNKISNGIEESVMRPQNLYINIDKLIEKQVIETTTLTESLPQIKSKVSQALLEAVNDINNTVK